MRDYEKELAELNETLEDSVAAFKRVTTEVEGITEKLYPARGEEAEARSALDKIRRKRQALENRFDDASDELKAWQARINSVRSDIEAITRIQSSIQSKGRTHE